RIPLSEPYIQGNISAVNIFFRSTAYERHEQQKQLQTADLLSNIAGSMGLFLGMSTVTLLEIFIYLFKSVWGTVNTERQKQFMEAMMEEENERRQSLGYCGRTASKGSVMLLNKLRLTCRPVTARSWQVTHTRSMGTITYVILRAKKSGATRSLFARNTARAIVLIRARTHPTPSFPQAKNQLMMALGILTNDLREEFLLYPSTFTWTKEEAPM
ncbi:hypothetical protein OSTOST_23238, partial [Ostertagia ostertagi]